MSHTLEAGKGHSKEETSSDLRLLQLIQEREHLANEIKTELQEYAINELVPFFPEIYTVRQAKKLFGSLEIQNDQELTEEEKAIVEIVLHFEIASNYDDPVLLWKGVRANPKAEHFLNDKGQIIFRDYPSDRSYSPEEVQFEVGDNTYLDKFDNYIFKTPDELKAFQQKLPYQQSLINRSYARKYPNFEQIDLHVGE